MSPRARVLALSSVLAACGSYEARDYWSDFAAAHCARMTECCTADEYADFYTPDAAGSTLQDCATVEREIEHADVIEDAIARGTIVFDRALADNCIAVLEVLTCPEVQPGRRHRESYCTDPLVGQVADGSACFVDDECATGNCQGADLRAVPMVPGMCRTPTPSGGACGIGTANCADPFVCQAGGVCGLGAPAGEACNADYQCASDWCKGDGSLSEGRCKQACDGV